MISIFKTAPQGIPKIDISETFNIFNLISTRQTSILSHQFYINYVHDRDFALILQSDVKAWANQVSELEEQAARFNMKTPRRTPVIIKFAANTDEITDYYIFNLILNELTAELYALSRAVISSTTNDSLHDIFTEHLLSHLRSYEILYKYGNMKGWMQVLPAYKTDKMIGKEPITVAEANNIWDHLVERYDQWLITRYFLSMVHDDDFKALLLAGTSVLDSQIKALEQLFEKFEIPLPDRPPLAQNAVSGQEAMEDITIYRNILVGIQSSVNLHTRAAIETVRNDKLRKLFMDYLREELAIYSKLFKYGKLKGWLRIVPIYRQG